MEEELGPKNINTLVLRVDYNFQYKSYPNLQNENALSEKDVKKLVSAAKSQNINIIPQVNLLGHQSWAGKLEKLLKEYPEFDETPHVKMPEKYVWPNADSLYCKSYCPLHPDVHEVVFAIVDEIVEAFESNAFHAGLDEVFYIGDDQCQRCQGKKKADLFAGEVTKIRNHLNEKNIQLWMWGDRLIDGKNTGIGMWEASTNNTQAAIDLIPKDVVICDWHYEKAEPTPPYFALHGLSIISCPWRIEDVVVKQIDQMMLYRKEANETLSNRMLGVMHTVWRPADSFLDAYYDTETHSESGDVRTFLMMTDYLETIKSSQP